MKEGINSVYDLFNSNRRYIIPSYQRNYAWTKEKQLKDFWEDIFYVDENKKYFLGTVLLRKDKLIKDASGFTEFEQWELIDGQQRSVTISIFLQVALVQLNLKIKDDRSLSPELKKQLLDEIENKKKIYIKNHGINKLDLLGEDSKFFNHYIVNYAELPDETITPSQQRIKEARNFFEVKLKDQQLKEVFSLIKKIENARVVIYPVTERDEAVLIFETVNDRGKPLSNLEKAKSFLMYMLYLASENAYKIKENIVLFRDDQEKFTEAIDLINESNNLLKMVEETFGRIFKYLDTLDKNNMTFFEDDVLRYHYVLWDKSVKGNYSESFNYLINIKSHFRSLLVRNKKLVFKEVEGYVSSLEQVFFSLKEIFVDILNPKRNEFKELREILSKIILLDRLANFYPLCISAWLNFKNDKDAVCKLLSSLEKYVFRVYIIANKRSDTGVNALYEIAFSLFNKKMQIFPAIEAVNDLSLNYISDSDFDYFLSNHNFFDNYSSREKKYLFYHYEIELRKKIGEPIDLILSDILSDEYSIEHILAKELADVDKPKGLRKKDVWENNVNKLGNLTLASKYWNSTFGNRKFTDKRDCTSTRADSDKRKYRCYRKSLFKCQQELDEYINFGLSQIMERETTLKKFIISHWQIISISSEVPSDAKPLSPNTESK